MASIIEGPRRVIGINKTTGRVTTELITSKNLHQGNGIAKTIGNPVRAGKTDVELERDLARWNNASEVLDDSGPSIRAGNPRGNR